MSTSDEYPFWDREDPDSDYYEYDRIMHEIETKYEVWDAMQSEHYDA